jgi:hypothetical protein
MEEKTHKWLLENCEDFNPSLGPSLEIWVIETLQTGTFRATGQYLAHLQCSAIT